MDLEAVVRNAPASAELLAFYRSRLEAVDAERRDASERIAAIEVSHEELHRLRWEVHAREKEIAELQRALRDAQVYLYDERDTALRLQGENEELKAREIENRRRIQHLLALTQPVTQEVTFFRECRPERVVRMPGLLDARVDSARASSTSGSLGRSAGGMSLSHEATRGGRVPAGGPVMDDTGVAPATVLRTVSMPSEQVDVLSMRVHVLQKQLEEMQTLADERAAVWRRDREQAEEDERRRAEADIARIQALERELSSERAKARATTRELLVTRHRLQAELRSAAEALATSRAALAQQSSEAAAATEHAAHELAAVQAASDEERTRLQSEAEQSARRREDDIATLQSEFTNLRSAYADRLRAQRDAFETLRARYAKLERRRARDLEGFSTDAANLRRALEQLEVQWALVGETAAAQGGLSAIAASTVPGARRWRHLHAGSSTPGSAGAAWSDEVSPLARTVRPAASSTHANYRPSRSAHRGSALDPVARRAMHTVRRTVAAVTGDPAASRSDDLWRIGERKADESDHHEDDNHREDDDSEDDDDATGEERPAGTKPGSLADRWGPGAIRSALSGLADRIESLRGRVHGLSSAR